MSIYVSCNVSNVSLSSSSIFISPDKFSILSVKITVAPSTARAQRHHSYDYEGTLCMRYNQYHPMYVRAQVLMTSLRTQKTGLLTSPINSRARHDFTEGYIPVLFSLCCIK